MKNTDVQENDALKVYFNQIKSIPLLTFEEELELSRRIQNGDEAARKRLIEANLRLVIKIAKSYLSADVSFMDIIQEGNLGLIHAVEKYDFAKNVRFSTYANWWIKQFISRYFSNKERTIRLPHRKEEILKKIKMTSQILGQKLMREARVDEIAEEIDVPVEKVAMILNMTSGIVSLDSDIMDEDNASVIDLHEDYTYNPEKEFIREASKEDAIRFLNSLQEKERKVLMYRYQFNGNEPHTLKSISDKMGISPETVRQIEIRALKSIRRQAAKIEAQYYVEAV